MCGRYANHVKQMGQWSELLQNWPEDAEIGYNIAPTQNAPVFTENQGIAMRWGLIPSWSKEASSKYATFNARVESAAEKPAFRGAWKQSNTCIVPAIGYYEWKGAKGAKQPYFIRPQNEEPLVMAGLWEKWGEQDNAVYSFTILTQSSSGSLESLHHRMPVMLDPATATHWLQSGTDAIEEVLAQQNGDLVEYFEVDTAVNKSTNEGEFLIRKKTA